MTTYEPLTVLPVDIQSDFGAEVFSATPTTEGVYRLVGCRRTQGNSFEGQRITVLVIDENGQAIPGVPIGFSYSTADRYTLTADFRWQPPGPHKAFIVRTGGGGMCDMVLGAEGVVKSGGAGGVTLYVLDPALSSDVTTGLGMLADHSGIHITMQRRQTGVVPLAERLTGIEARLEKLEGRRTGEADKPPQGGLPRAGV